MGTATQQPARMTASGIGRVESTSPPIVLLYGTEGIGKTTWAANAPKPVFVASKREVERVGGINAFSKPFPKSYEDVVGCVEVLTNEDLGYQTLVIDTMDWLEPLLWDFVCKRDNQKNLDAYGYGKGQVAALAEWRVFLSRLERLRRARDMGVVMVAHAYVKTWKNPLGDDFDRYVLKLHDRAGGLLKEWSDCVLFVNFEEFAVKDEKKRVRGISTGARIVHTVRHAAWDAKNRFDLPEQLPLNYQDFADAIQAHRPASPDKLRKDIAELVKGLGDLDLAKKVREAVKKANGDAASLAKIKDRLIAKLGQKEEVA